VGNEVRPTNRSPSSRKTSPSGRMPS